MFPTEPAPETIGAYKILRRLAGSGSTSVYLGRLDGPLGFRRVCELKLVPNTAEGDPRFADELAREASICATLNHPAIVRMFDFFEHGGKLVLVLEHVEGVNLGRLLQHLAARQQKLADAAVYYLVHCIASALSHAHGATDEHGSPTPVIHRNLHPENIVIGWDGQVRLTGFGIGKILGRTPDTIAGVVKGAPGYMAPEQVRAERVTVKADIYGVGLLLWSLLTGRRPAADGTRPVAITTIRPEIPRPIVALLETALAQAPEDRKLSCQEIEQTLAKVARPEKGKAELVTRVQSAHATIELEDADPEEDRRPTIPVKGKGGQTSRPAADAAKRLAKDLFAKDARGEKPKPGVAQADTARPPAAAAAAAAMAGAARRDGPAGARGPEPITIPAPAVEPPPLPPGAKGGAAGKPPEVRKPALPDRETFGRLYEASKRAAERDAAAAEEEAAGGMPTLPEDEPSFDEEDDDATLPGSGTASSRFGISIAPIPEAIRFGPPPALPADLAPDLAPVFFGPPPPKPPSGAPLTPSGVAVPVGASGLTPPGGVPAVGGSGLTPPGVTVPVPVGSPGLGPPGGGPHPGKAGFTSGVSSEPPLSAGAGPSSRRRRGPAQLWQAPRSLSSTVGTIAVSAITATVVAGLWIYVARRERPVVAVTAQVEEAPPAEPVISAAPAVAPTPAPSAKRGAAARTPAKASASAAAGSASAAAAAASASAAAAAASASAAAAAASASAAAAAASASAAAAAASASAAAAAAPPPATKAPAASPARAEPSVASLAKGQGLLTVGYPDAGGVYVNGKFTGLVNEALVVRCGRYFVRVGKASNVKFPEWLSAGVTAQVPCQGAVRIDIKPTAPPKKRAR
ncbi:serine/threonine-protein kinase [Sorangium sp. So ce131]|uniref:serine/threonine-protein kinase n=1 Tax=Sorangium sp. So ce131 TaxID=3133282 RepID=UPI003F5DF6D4